MYMCWCNKKVSQENVSQESSKMVSRTWHSCHTELFLTPHVSESVAQVNASGRSQVSQLWLDVSKSILPAKYTLSNKSFLCQLNFTDFIKLSESGGKSDHLQFLGIPPELKHRYLSLSLSHRNCNHAGTGNKLKSMREQQRPNTNYTYLRLTPQ